MSLLVKQKFVVLCTFVLSVFGFIHRQKEQKTPQQNNLEKRIFTKTYYLYSQATFKKTCNKSEKVACHQVNRL